MRRRARSRDGQGEKKAASYSTENKGTPIRTTISHAFQDKPRFITTEKRRDLSAGGQKGQDQRLNSPSGTSGRAETYSLTAKWRPIARMLGYSLMRTAHWYNSRMLVVLLLLLVWPIGLYGLWRSYRFSRLAKTALLFVSVIPLLALAHYSPYSIPGRWTITDRDAEPTAFELGESRNKLLSAELSAARMSQRQFVIGFDADASKKIKDSDPGGQYRLCRYSANYGFNDSAPSSVTVSGAGESDSRTELSRTIFTYSAQDSSFSWRGVAAVFYAISLILSCIVSLAAILELAKSPSKAKLSIDLVMWAFFIVPAVGLTILFGYVSGRKIVIDNATEKTLEVRMDGKKMALLPPLTFVQERVVGSTLDVEVLENGHLLESGKLRLDAGINLAVEPALLGHGKYIYNIGASNTYRVITVNYSKQP